jgi:hypothetical protein
MFKLFSSLALFLLVLLLLPTSVVAFGKLPGTVKGLDVGNSHFVAEREGSVYRGSEPGKKVQELVEFGFTDVLIIKNSTRGEVEKEMLALQELGMPASRITHLPMQWNKAGIEVQTCEYMIDALKAVNGVLKKSGRKLYFHCTVGEDRTGALAGLTRMLEEGLTADQATQNELCARGYAEGNPNKPAKVNAQIHANLNPVFAKLATLIEAGELKWSNLNKSVCQQDVETGDPSIWKCR